MNDSSNNIKDIYLKVKDHPDLIDVIPDEMGVSFPVPMIKEKKDASEVYMVFFHFYMRMAQPNEFVISSPRYKTTVKYDDASIIATEKITSKLLGVDWDDSKPVGKYLSDPAVPYEKQIERRERFFALYDRITSYYIAGKSSLDGDEKKNMLEFKSLFYELSHPPLLPYYKSMNPEFFKWIENN